MVRVVSMSVACIAVVTARAGALCSSTDLRLDREVGPMVAFAPQRPLQRGDRERARALLSMIRTAIASYRNVRRAAELSPVGADVQIRQWLTYDVGRLIAVPLPDTHDNEHRPRIVLYHRTPGGIRLFGAQFEAQNERTDAELDDILPTSIARWHQVVRHCTAPPVAPPWFATVFPYARDEAAAWGTLELSRYVTIAPRRHDGRGERGGSRDTSKKH